jgi:hypothetical protein
VLREEGRGFFQDFALLLEDPILFAEPRQLIALGRRQPGAALGSIGLRLLDPLAQRRRHQIQLAGDGGDAFALV